MSSGWAPPNLLCPAAMGRVVAPLLLPPCASWAFPGGAARCSCPQFALPPCSSCPALLLELPSWWEGGKGPQNLMRVFLLVLGKEVAGEEGQHLTTAPRPCLPPGWAETPFFPLNLEAKPHLPCALGTDVDKGGGLQPRPGSAPLISACQHRPGCQLQPAGLSSAC